MIPDEVTPHAWQDDAACAQIAPELWFPPKGGSAREAKTICNTCPVKNECLAYALTTGERHGIYGGLTAHERGRGRTA